MPHTHLRHFFKPCSRKRMPLPYMFRNSVWCPPTGTRLPHLLYCGVTSFCKAIKSCYFSIGLWGCCYTDILNHWPCTNLHPLILHRVHHCEQAAIRGLQPFSCKATLFRGRNLIEHSKLAPSGEQHLLVASAYHSGWFGREEMAGFRCHFSTIGTDVPVQFVQGGKRWVQWVPGYLLCMWLVW